MNREELLKSRGFRSEEHLNEFLDACTDETWKQELIEYFGETPKSDKKSNKKSNKKSKEVEEVIEEEIPEETESEIIEETSEEINEEE